MTDKQYEETKARLEAVLTKWHPLLQMGWYTLSYTYIRGYDEDPSTVAVTKAQWVYRKAYITWFMEKINELTDEQLENVVIHEFCHVILAPATQDQPEEWHEQVEFVTETVAILFANVLNAGKEGFYAGPTGARISRSDSNTPVKPD